MDYHAPSWASAQPLPSPLVVFLVPSLWLASLQAVKQREQAVQEDPVGVWQAACVAQLDQVRPLASCLVHLYPLQDQPELQLLTGPLGMVFDDQKLLKHHLYCSAVSVGQGEQRVR